MRGRRGLSLARKGFILLLIPALVQGVLLIGLSLLHRETGLSPKRDLLGKTFQDRRTIFLSDAYGTLHEASNAVNSLSTVAPSIQSRLDSMRD